MPTRPSASGVTFLAKPVADPADGIGDGKRYEITPCTKPVRWPIAAR